MLRNEESISTKFHRIEELARNDVTMHFTSLAHLLTSEFLAQSFASLNQKGAAGVDKITMDDFKEDLADNLTELHESLKNKRYRASSVRRKGIPKANGKIRYLGIPTVRDRVVQKAVSRIISAVYEPYFIDHSYGFRPGRSCHTALEELRMTANKKWTNFIVDADIASYFDTVNHQWLMKFLEHRIKDKTILNLVGKWLKSGIMDNGVLLRNTEGTPQGGPISPLLANIYLHYVLDLWFEKKFRKTCRGKCEMIRYADDFVVCFENRDEAERFNYEVKVRFETFNLKLSEEKTKLVDFGRYQNAHETKGKPGVCKTFDFLGFTHYRRKRKNYYAVAVKPSRKSRNSFLLRVKEWLRYVMHTSVYFQAKILRRKLIGYYNYFNLRNCRASLNRVLFHVKRLWLKALRRRSQRNTLTWEKFLNKPWAKMLPSVYAM